MKKWLVYSIFTFLISMTLAACNTNTEDQATQDYDSRLTPNTNNQGELSPDPVSFSGTPEQGNNAGQGQGRDEIPVNPGREQNIFEGPQELQRRIILDGNRERQSPPNENRANQNTGQAGEQNTTPGNQNQGPTENQQGNQNQSLTEFQSRVVELTNQERQNNGLPALQSDQELMNVAQTKSEDMASVGYFSHTSPTYGSPFDMLQQYGIEYSTAAENIARGQQSPEAVVEGWMNSEGHRKNILNQSVTHIGVGYASNGSYWTQLFIAK